MILNGRFWYRGTWGHSILVTQKDDKYLLLCGERRYLAAQKLGMETIPVRIFNTVTQKDEILAIQLTENLQREGLFQF
ncbi:MAG: ParB N-terminal domain-containing protein [Proteobacteria bacterium]|nr:ParB N-terminal domain-containing protein [Pseudomonadota bacterium]